jgi:hypothetical protein
MVLPFLLISIFSQIAFAGEEEVPVVIVVCDPDVECSPKANLPYIGGGGSGNFGGGGNGGGSGSPTPPAPTPEEIKAKCLHDAEPIFLLDLAGADMKHYSRLKNNCKWVAGFPTGGATTLCIEISNSLLNANNHVIAGAKSRADFACNNP